MGNRGDCDRRPTLTVASILHLNSKGTIVNIGSKIADTGQGGTSGYAAYNGGINALTREWAVDLLKFGIRVNCVAPAEVITPLYEKWLANTPDPQAALQKLNQTVPLWNPHDDRRRGCQHGGVRCIGAFLAYHRADNVSGWRIRAFGPCLHGGYQPFANDELAYGNSAELCLC